MYHSGLYKYVYKEMYFLGISSLGVAYRCIVKIEQKFKKNNKMEFGYANQHEHNLGKHNPNSLVKIEIKDRQNIDNQPKPQENKGNEKS